MDISLHVHGGYGPAVSIYGVNLHLRFKRSLIHLREASLGHGLHAVQQIKRALAPERTLQFFLPFQALQETAACRAHMALILSLDVRHNDLSPASLDRLADDVLAQVTAMASATSFEEYERVGLGFHVLADLEEVTTSYDDTVVYNPAAGDVVTTISTWRTTPPAPAPTRSPRRVRSYLRLRKVAHEKVVFADSHKNDDNDNNNGGGEELGCCSVCLEDFTVGGPAIVRLIPCRHVYHQSCIVGWLRHRKTTCPLCRRTLERI